MPILSRRNLLVLGGAGVVASCGDNRVGIRETPPLYRDLARFGAVVDSATAASMISGYRQNNGLAPVVDDPRLNQVALDLVQALAAKDSIELKLEQLPLKQRIAAHGMTATIADENVSAGYHTLAEAFSGWRESKPNDRVMKLPGATRFGIATAYAPRSKYLVYWALIMADGQ